MAYLPALPNRFDIGAIPFKVLAKYFEEYLGESHLTAFMGTSTNDAIQVFETNNGEGTSLRVSFRKDLNYENPVIGFDQAAGAEQPIELFTDEIKLNLQRFVDMLMGVPLVRQQTPLEVFGAMRPLLLNAQKRNLVKSILDSSCGTVANGGLYTSADGGDGPQTDRVVYAKTSAALYDASIFTAIAGMEDATHDKSGLSVAHLRKLKSMAITGGQSLENESRIKPVELKSRRGFQEEMYIYLMDTDSYVSLSNDPAWRDFVYRGVIQSDDQPEGISGARYRGMVDGVMVYECPELARYRAVSGGKTAAWNLFLGAQAFGLAWAKRPWFEMEQRDFNLNTAMAVCEIRGQKALMFPSFQDDTKLVERGIIHSFVQIV